MVPNTSDDLPDPETPVNTVSRRLGISTLTSLRLFSRAPWTRIEPWLSAECCLEETMLVSAAARRAALGCIGQHEQVPAAEEQQEERRQRRVGDPRGWLLPVTRAQREEVGDDGDRKDDGQPAVRLPN